MSHVPCWISGRPFIPIASLGGGAPITEWLVAGPVPFDYPGDFTRHLQHGRLDTIPADPLDIAAAAGAVEGQAYPDPARPERIGRWRRLSGAAEYDLSQEFPAAGLSVVYAVARLVAEAPADVVLLAEGMMRHRRFGVRLSLDGAAVTEGGEPALVRIEPGEHVLVAKIAGASGPRGGWRLAIRAGIVRPVGHRIGLGLVRLPGYWRGPEDAPRVEVEAVAANLSAAAACTDDLVAALDGCAPGPAGPTVTLEPGRARAIRLSAPLGDRKPGERVTVAVSRGAEQVVTETTIPPLPVAGVYHVLEGFHCDPVWIFDQHHYNLISLDNVRQLLDACLADHGYRAFLHEIDYLKPFIDEYPDYRAALFGLVREGRIALGSSYNEPNENNCSGEAIIRNILYGHGFHRHFLGGEPGVYHAWDVFGHAPQMSQIIAKSGLSGFLWCKHILGFMPVFRHMALDGTVLPHIRVSYSWTSHSMDHLRDGTASLLAENRTYGLRRHLVNDSSDFSPPSGWMIGRAKEMADSYPHIVMSSAEEFLQGLAEDGARLRLTSRTESQYHVGTFHSRPEMKIANRMCENALFAAECWATFAALMGATYPDRALDKAWRQVLFNQHHDALSGTPCDMSYLDLMAGYREALELAGGVAASATQFIADAVNMPAGDAAGLVFNPLNWARGGVVTLPKPHGATAVEVRTADGVPVPAIIEDDEVKALVPAVPSVGYTTVTVRAMATAGVRSPNIEAASADSTPAIENEFWRIELDPARGGGIASLVDKAAGQELIDRSIGVGDDLVAFAEGENAWEFHTYGPRIAASEFPAKVEVTRAALGETAVVTGRLGDVCTYRRTLTVRPGQREIEASVRLEGYRGQEGMFAVTTPVLLAGALPVFEDRFGTVVGRRGKRKFDYRTAGHVRLSDCFILPVYNWVEAGWSAQVDVGDGASGLNLGIAGLVISHDERVEAAMEPLLAALGHVGVTCTPYYDDDDMLRRADLERAFPHGPFDCTLENRADDVISCAEWIVLDVGGANAYARDLLARLPDAAGAAARAHLAAEETRQGWGMVVAEDDRVPDGWPPQPVLLVSAATHDALGVAIVRLGEDLARDGRIRLPAGSDPRPRKGTLDDRGFAILTTGTGAATMEPDGALTLFLTRTAAFPGTHLPGRLVPEHRSMILHYAYLPHAGSWRDGGVVRAGYEFAHPLAVAVPRDSDAGRRAALPVEGSFLSLSAAAAVITAIKPAGNPISRFEAGPSDPARGIVVRAYDSSGRGARGKLMLARPIAEARATDLMEEDRGPLVRGDACADWTLGPFSIETTRVVPAAGVWPEIGAATLGPDREPFQPVSCRYWRHNVGAHPLGYLPVAIYLDGDPARTAPGATHPAVGRVRVTVVNNCTDRAIEGVAELVAPAAWTLLPAEVPYRLAPREHMTRDVTVAFGHAPHVGLLKARLVHEGQVYQDVLEVGRRTEVTASEPKMAIGKEREPAWHVFRDGADIVARVENPWREPLEVELAVISPVETWGAAAGRYALGEIAPRAAGLSIPGGQERLVRFHVCPAERPPAFWAWVKLMCNGKADYRPAP